MTASPSVSATPPTSAPAAEAKSGWTITRVIIASIVGFIVVIVALFVIAVILALTSSSSLGPIIELIRNFVIIVLTVEGILIGVAFAIFVAQIARLVNLLQNETKPILENAQETVKVTSGTARFVGDNIARPVIVAGGFMAGARSLLGDLGGIRRAIKHTVKDAKEEAEKAKDAVQKK
ncbi:MAG: hypothetical protein H7175_12075 [Burkholderiales bacterium]|nr:hypothetical protein [Anaerolineae bacterium]